MTKRNLLKVGSRTVGGKDLFFTVEEGMANLGDYNKALMMIDAAAATTADAIEFQLVIASDLCVRSHPIFDFCLNCEFSNSQIAGLVARAKERGLEFLAVPLSNRLVEPLVKAGCSAFNINASDLTNPAVIDAVADSGLPFFLSVPLATEKEIDWAVDRIRRSSSAQFGILHGQHTMMSGGVGVDASQTSLGYISSLKRRYKVPVGFIDHTPYTWMPSAAVSAGADSVSKHLALSREDKGPDWQVCLEPGEMKETVIWARKTKQSINEKGKRLASGEEMDRSKMRRSIVASRRIGRGRVVQWEDIAFKRPGTGIDPSRYGDVVGRKVTRDMSADDQINISDIEET
jgi:sialic acid synthase SpsE